MPCARLAVAILACSVVAAAHAQAWPSKPVRLVVPYPPGGATDVAARAVAERIAPALGQSVLIENRAGAGGNIGIEYVVKSEPDGYTVLVAPDFVTSAPHVYKLNYDPMKQLVPVIQLSRQPVILGVHPSLGVSTVAELVALAKAKPGLGYATSGAGSQQHIAAEWFAKSAGIELTHVPYKGGAQAVTDFVGGQVPLVSIGAAPLMPYYKSGRVSLLAQTTQTRSPHLPDIPTLVELGFPSLVIEQWQGVFLPANTPKEIVARLNAEIVKALAEPKVREFYSLNGLEPVGNTQAQFAEVVRVDYEKYGRLLRELRIKID
jgi:tripartite-type tricarboxylate transporter receptor subunit TctC